MIESDCVFHKNNIDFDMPRDLLAELFSDKIALFAGSGISTENENVLGNTFYQEISYDLGYDSCDLPFSSLMEEFCKQTNGRIKLLSKIKHRFDNIDSFPELYRNASRFHRELSTLFYINNIITTNWDSYFESECGAIPLVTPEDLVFWNTFDRKVLKIHGSINNLGSIIATTQDYTKCYENMKSGILGSTLKHILATKTIVYVGYSFRDEDFIQIHSFVRNEMKELMKQAYIVTLDKENDYKYKELNLLPIYTDGTYFVEVIKKHALRKKLMVPDSLYALAELLLDIVRQEHQELHERFNCYDNPEMIYSGFYQDGRMHAYERILSLKKTGVYSDHSEFWRTRDIYKELIKERKKLRKYEDIPYLEGYLDAHLRLLFFIEKGEEIEGIPLYYVYGHNDFIYSLEEYVDIIKQVPDLHKASYKYAKRMISRKAKYGTKIDFHHPAHL